MSKLSKLKHKILVWVFTYIYNHPSWVQLFESIRTKKNGQKVFDLYQGEVQLGPFKGTQIPISAVNKAPDFGANLILGTYEQQILDFVCEKPWDVLLNIGAAHGWYGVTLLRKKIVKKVYFFESDAQLHPIIREFASTNDVSDGIEILGHADENFLSLLYGVPLANETLVILDVEGGETSLLNHENIFALSKCHLVIELHEFTPQMSDECNDLILRLQKYFEISIIDGLTRVVPQGIEIKGVTNLDLHNLTFEFRPNAMRWLKCKPKG